MQTNSSPKAAYFVFGLWASVALSAVLAGAFAVEPGAPSTGLAVQLVAVAGLALLAVAVSPRLRDSVRALDPAVLTALQSWRVLGMMFLFLMALGDLPAVFAIPAGIGDVLIGLSAPFLVAKMHQGTLTRRGFGWFTALGLLDFVVAFAFGNYVNLTTSAGSGFASMTALPLVLVPGFFVPAFALLHLAAWISFRDSRARSPERSESRIGKGARTSSIALVALAVPFAAGAETSIGGSYGSSRLQHDAAAFDDGSWSVIGEDDSDVGWKLFGDFRFSPHVAVEVGYVDLNGDVDSETTFAALSDGSGRFAAGEVAVDLDEPRAAYVVLVGRVPFGDRFSGFIKGGLHLWEADVTTQDAAGSITVGESGEDGVFGVGVEASLGKRILLRAEIERFLGIVGDDIDLASIGFAIRLGSGS